MVINEIGSMLSAGAAGPVSRQDPRGVGVAFEAMFLQQFLAGMGKTAGSFGPEKSGMAKMQEEWVWNLLTQTVSQNLAETDQLGLKNQIQAYFTEGKK